ncbi:MAG TPA: FHA domain-containing protein, partial [Thermoanaerobaculia bacterium]|nr:FHA domain-containing protein [Thermoanaerobaculia bacterium]
TLVSELRTTLGDREIIRTVHRIGYAFTAATRTEEAVRFALMLGDEELPLRAGENVIGRDPRDAIVIHSPEVSRHHARLFVHGSTITVQDLGSKNGTYIGTRRVTTSERVRPGDDILVGTVRLRLVQVDSLATTATAI